MRTAALISIASLTAAAGASTPRLLIDRELETKPIQLISIADGLIVYDDEAGLRRTERWENYLAVLDPEARIDRHDGAPQETDTLSTELARAFTGEVSVVALTGDWILETVRGERLLGSVLHAPQGSSPDAIAWQSGDGSSPTLIPLETIDRLAPQRFGLPQAEDLLDDLVVTITGDRLTGFVESINHQVTIETDLGVVPLPLGSASYIDIANPAEEPSGMMVWLSDGSIYRARQLLDASRPGFAGAVQIQRADAAEPSESSESPDQPVSTDPIPLIELAAVTFDASGFTPLSVLELESQRPIAGRRWHEPASFTSAAAEPLSAGDLVLPGPMEVRWVLPTGATRLAFDAELPPAARRWGHCELVVLVALSDDPASAQELSRQSFTGTEPTARIAVDLPSPQTPRRRLILRLEESSYGPIQDELVLRQPLLAMPSN